MLNKQKSNLTGVISGERHADHQQLMQLSNQAANGLRDIGIKLGDAVAILMRNDISFIVATRAANRVGAYAVPLNWHASAEDIAYVLNDIGAKVLVVHADLLAEIDRMIPEYCQQIVVETPTELASVYALSDKQCRVPEHRTVWDKWLEKFSTEFDHPSKNHGSVVYTSGTTGRPKGIVRVPVNGDAELRMFSIMDEVFGVGRNDSVRTLIPAPLYHAAPNFWAARSSERESLALLLPRFDAEEVLRKIEQFSISHLYLVPTMMVRLLRLDQSTRQRYDISSLVRVVHSAAPCAPAVKREIIEWFGPKLHEFYGGTENGCITIHDSHEAMMKPGTVGRPMQNCKIKIFNSAGGEVPIGQPGEIFARNFNLPEFSYHNLPHKRAEVERGGLITIGDIGYLDGDGYLFLCDRKRDMVISGGVNIYPAEIEFALQSMPGIYDCAVFGIPHAEFGESLCAHVQTQEYFNITKDDVVQWLKHRLAAYLVPKTIEFVSALPREESGKIMKRRIRDQYWEKEGRVI